MPIPRCTRTATLKGRLEKRGELVALPESLVPRSRTETGCIDFHIQVSRDDLDVFFFCENWTTREALDVHLNVPYQKDLFARHDESLARPVEPGFFGMVSADDRN